MWKYEELMCKHEYLNFEELDNFPSFQDGYINGSNIYINKNLTPQKKHEIIGEEIAHFNVNDGDILDQSKSINRKFEGYARRHSYEMLIPIEELKKITYDGIQIHEIAQHFEVTEDFVKKALRYYEKTDKMNNF